jgi:hypothetical protein
MIPRASARPVARALGALPWTAELYQRWKGQENPPQSGFRLDRLRACLPAWVEAARRMRTDEAVRNGKRVLVFAYLSWWIEHAALLSMLLAAAGHDVHLRTLPFRRWTTDPNPFDLRRQRAYLGELLRPAGSLLRHADLAAGGREGLSPELERSLERQSRLDLQYTLQREDVDDGAEGPTASLLRLRQRRNRAAAEGALAWIRRIAPQVVIIPNGSILEFGAVFHAARSRKVTVTTYEFGEQRDRLWLSIDGQVMKQDTQAMWDAVGRRALTMSEEERLRDWFAARKVGSGWENFSRAWQSGLSAGAASVRERLGLDAERPVVLICTNVVGDSLALDRQVFSRGMSDWLTETVRILAPRSDLQVVVRVHPGELLGAGHPSQDIVRGSIPEMPDHVHVVAPGESVNTYDLIELSHVGVVYTTTVGLEMAMAGVPVVVAGRTHYRGKGFTYDPSSWEAYRETLERLIRRPRSERLPSSQTDLARRYAYRFFFDYPLPYPWHLIGFWKDVTARPPEAFLQPETMGGYRRTLEALVGESLPWGGAAE